MLRGQDLYSKYKFIETRLGQSKANLKGDPIARATKSERDCFVEFGNLLQIFSMLDPPRSQAPPSRRGRQAARDPQDPRGHEVPPHQVRCAAHHPSSYPACASVVGRSACVLTCAFSSRSASMRPLTATSLRSLAHNPTKPALGPPCRLAAGPARPLLAGRGGAPPPARE